MLTPWFKIKQLEITYFYDVKSACSSPSKFYYSLGRSFECKMTL